ncbi:MAG: hypothetical protein WCJ64_00915 [Rhodospirillaceae bacterium]
MLDKARKRGQDCGRRPGGGRDRRGCSVHGGRAGHGASDSTGRSTPGAEPGPGQGAHGRRSNTAASDAEGHALGDSSTSRQLGRLDDLTQAGADHRREVEGGTSRSRADRNSTNGSG